MVRSLLKKSRCVRTDAGAIAVLLSAPLWSACDAHEHKPAVATHAPAPAKAAEPAAQAPVVPVPRIQAALNGLPNEEGSDEAEDPAAALEAARHNCCDEMPATQIEEATRKTSAKHAAPAPH
ncbi:MAG: hypothetical protein RL701_3452 [Pseudomonadota bacterium]